MDRLRPSAGNVFPGAQGIRGMHCVNWLASYLTLVPFHCHCLREWLNVHTR